MNGEYTEKLSTGGELKVTPSMWCISYYFSGPDLRYNGTFVSIPGKEIDEYIQAWRDNFKKYLDLKKAIPKDGEYNTYGEKNMSIRIGNWCSGVCLKSYHMPINNEEELEAVLCDYEYAKKRAHQLQTVLSSL